GVCLDLQRTAQTVAYLLGGDFTTGATLPTVPEEMRQLLERSATAPSSLHTTPWKLREELGELARRAFGPPSFNPIGMPPLEFHKGACPCAMQLPARGRTSPPPARAQASPPRLCFTKGSAPR